MSIYKVIDLQLYQQSIKIQNILKCPKHETKLTRNTLNSYQFDGLIWKTNAYGSSEKSKVTIWRLC